MARHHQVNDLVWRSLCKANIPAVKEPSGLARDDGKRPDGITLIPWQAGKSVAWDVTVVNTVANSYVDVSTSPGGAAEQAAERKTLKYSFLQSTFSFQPLAFESLGPMHASAIDFISELGHRLTSVSGDPRESAYLFQRLSLSIQRYNAITFTGSFLHPPDDAD